MCISNTDIESILRQIEQCKDSDAKRRLLEKADPCKNCMARDDCDKNAECGHLQGFLVEQRNLIETILRRKK
ncbi:hypothetical protein DPQ33_18015 [Oceanidesulfovibrio indonesiensis]|uniref:Uncharacterized protein n=1 Tax=Oceanidesulfovibrio indonesiensis TaxID=54767 RepID=A0A7M3M9X5_9BACT|nr:hypothetical protein DPQ33_18015 [Oceanidesulfovibrio indonesiensis]